MVLLGCWSVFKGRNKARERYGLDGTTKVNAQLRGTHWLVTIASPNEIDDPSE
jgi:hypothetical protein